MEANHPVEIIAKARPDLKPATLKQYRTQLNKMEKLFGKDWWHDSNRDPKPMIKKIHDSDLSDTYKRNLFMVSLVLFLSRPAHTHMKQIEAFREEMDKMNAKYQKDHSDNPDKVISENQKENMISYAELRKYIDMVKKDRMDSEELYTAYVVLESLFRVPVRNDHAGLRLIGLREFNKLSKEDRKGVNYLIETKGKLTFAYYQDDTTTKTRPEEFQVLPKDLERIWRKYLNVRDFTRIHNSARAKYPKGIEIVDMNRNQLSKLLTRVSQKYINKNISTTLIRKIVIHHFFGETKKAKAEQEAFAKKVGHTLAVEDMIYNKA